MKEALKDIHFLHLLRSVPAGSGHLLQNEDNPYGLAQAVFALCISHCKHIFIIIYQGIFAQFLHVLKGKLSRSIPLGEKSTLQAGRSKVFFSSFSSDFNDARFRLIEAEQHAHERRFPLRRFRREGA